MWQTQHMRTSSRWILIAGWLVLAAGAQSLPAEVRHDEQGAPGDGGSGERLRFPRLIYRERPAFPERAAHAGIWDATVAVSITIHRDGSVEPLEVMQCSNRGFGFEDEALRTVASWRYSPALSDGRPVEVVQAVIVRFHREARSFSI